MISILLVAMLLITTVVVSSVSVSATGTLANCYATNPNNGFGKQATITVDGSASDWSNDMMIARLDDCDEALRENPENVTEG